MNVMPLRFDILNVIIFKKSNIKSKYYVKEPFVPFSWFLYY